ncbi:MAG: hypothetical protein F4X02_16250 [Chloroflexi bacterium]|nr:hypothetical protein [Chloroflexota bacterium]
MKLDKLDFVVFILVALCLAGVAIAAYLIDPARQAIEVAYLYPALGSPQNVWLSDIGTPGHQRQLTFSERGVSDFDISPDGRWLVYAEHSDGRGVALRLLDMRGGKDRDLVDCASVSALCTAPVFSPNGELLAYQRSESLGASFGLSRIWLVDMLSADYDTAPLIGDTQIVGHSAVWSADSNMVGFYSAETAQPGILLYSLSPPAEDEVQLRFIPTSYGVMGTLSPNGQQIIFPDLVFRDGQFYGHLQIADLAAKEFAAFTDSNGPFDDVAAQFSPDGRTVAIARRYTDTRWTQGHQLYIRALVGYGADWQALAYDPDYNTSYFRWDADGERLVTQRFPFVVDQESGVPARPEVWVHDLTSGESRKIIDDAYLPKWVAR